MATLLRYNNDYYCNPSLPLISTAVMRKPPTVTLLRPLSGQSSAIVGGNLGQRKKKARGA